MTPTLEFFYDVVSPYSYLASKRIEAIADRCGVELKWRPVLLGGIFKTIGNQPPAILAQRGRYMVKDLHRTADYYDIPFKLPDHFPTNSLHAMRAITSFPENEIPMASHKLFQVYWERGEDIGEDKIIASVLGEKAVADAELPAIKEKLKENTQEAIDRGAFGVPTFFINNEMFFGQDRFFLLEDFIQKNIK